MECLGLEPGAAGWKAQTNPLSYSGTPYLGLNLDLQTSEVASLPTVSLGVTVSFSFMLILSYWVVHK